MNLKKVTENEKISKSNIGLKIQGLMEQHNASLSKVATATGLTSETIRQIVNGTIKNPGIETLSKIAEAFSISLYQLLETRDVTSHINKKKIKIIDIFDLQKLKPGKKIDDLINQSVESTEILHIDNNHLNSDIFAVEVSPHLADKLTNCGMPMLRQRDLLIFVKDGDCSTNSIILAKYNDDVLMLGIIMEVDEKTLWIKSVDIPQKQVVMAIKREQLIGVVHNVQFSK